MENKNPITVRVAVKAPIEKIWEYWTAPKHITQWAFASDDWECPVAENDVREGAQFKTTMAAKDGSAKFDVVGTYSVVKQHDLIEYTMEDGRHVKVEFIQKNEEVEVIETFDPEQENTEELQRSGWQSILDNFKKHVEATHANV